MDLLGFAPRQTCNDKFCGDVRMLCDQTPDQADRRILAALNDET